jgi:hypothetical protein
MFGVAVFRRTELAGEKGTKEWILRLINSIIPNTNILFLDDSIDHIKSVSSAKLEKVNAQLVKSKLQVSQYISLFNK